MLTRTQKLVLLIAGGVLLFVVLCPLTPTPTAVVKKQIVLALMLVAAAVLLWRPNQPAFGSTELEFVGARAGLRNVLDLTCLLRC
jgi:hypothetical protein